MSCLGTKKVRLPEQLKITLEFLRQPMGARFFLDEIADASPQLQRSLLRVLQEGEIRRVGETEDHIVDVRIIAATNRDLKRKLKMALSARICIIGCM